MSYRLVRQVRDDPLLRKSFMELALEVFDLSFEEWYQNGNWSGSYLPYAMVEGNRVIANVSVNLMDFLWEGERRRYIQLGTVMTHPDFRGQGLCRRLMEQVLEDWQENCDSIYLFANSTVLDFYPKFGFVREQEQEYSLPAFPEREPKQALSGDFRKLSTGCPEDRQLLFQCFDCGNPFSRFAMTENRGLLMFYCGGFFKDCIYYSQKYHAAAIAEMQGDTLFCHDLLGGQGVPFTQLLYALCPAGTRQITLGFTPAKDLLQELPGLQSSPISSDDEALFLYKGKENLFQSHKLRFPTLSIA